MASAKSVRASQLIVSVQFMWLVALSGRGMQNQKALNGEQGMAGEEGKPNVGTDPRTRRQPNPKSRFLWLKTTIQSR
jgi:hypothetical protein